MYIKRINKELSLLNPLYNISYNEHTNTIIDIYVYLNDRFKVNFVLDNSYPFSKPKIYIEYDNKKDLYLDFLKLKYSRFLTELNNRNIKCLCCDSILCNWKPSHMLVNIVDEIKSKSIDIKKMVYSSYARIICSENNIPDELINIIIYQLNI